MEYPTRNQRDGGPPPSARLCARKMGECAEPSLAASICVPMLM